MIGLDAKRERNKQDLAELWTSWIVRLPHSLRPGLISASITLCPFTTCSRYQRYLSFSFASAHNPSFIPTSNSINSPPSLKMDQVAASTAQPFLTLYPNPTKRLVQRTQVERKNADQDRCKN